MASRWAVCGKSRHVMGAVFALVGCFYFWTVCTTRFPLTLGKELPDQYNQLADALLHGQLSMRAEPDPGLLALENPYDPDANVPYRVGPRSYWHDASFYRGKIYTYFGVTPVLVLFLPWRMLGLHALPTGLAALAFTTVGFVCSVKLLHRVLVLHQLTPPLTAWVSAIVALGFCNVAPFVLRRPAIYEVAISCGYCFLFLGLYLVVRAAFRDPPRLVSLGFGSLCLALAVGARPFWVLAAPVLALLYAHLLVRAGRGNLREAIRLGLVLFVPYCGFGLLLALYNYCRFGSLTDFGWKYQLAGCDVRKLHAGWDLVPVELFLHLLSPFRLDATFPFVHLCAKWPWQPPCWMPIEANAGLLVTNPFLLFLLFAPWVWPASGKEQRPLTLLILPGLPLLAFAVILMMSYLGMVTLRYQMDYAALVLVAALFTWFQFLGRLNHQPRHARVACWVGCLLLGFGCSVNLAYGMVGYDNSLHDAHPCAYHAIRSWFSLPSQFLALFLPCHEPGPSDGDPGPQPAPFEGLALASAARTTGPWAGPFTTTDGRGIIVYLNVKAAPPSPGAGGLRVVIYAMGPLNEVVQLNPPPAPIHAPGAYGFVVYPGVSTAVGTTTQTTAGVLPPRFLLHVNHLDNQSYTYSLSYSTLK